MTPHERAWADYAAEAAAYDNPPLTAAQRVEYADRMMKTTGGQMRVLSYSADVAIEAASTKMRRFMSEFRKSVRR